MSDAKRAAEVSVPDEWARNILDGLGKFGFLSSGFARVYESDGKIVLDFCINSGRYDTKIKAVPIQIVIPLTEDEKKMSSQEAEPS